MNAKLVKGGAILTVVGLLTYYALSPWIAVSSSTDI